VANPIPSGQTFNLTVQVTVVAPGVGTPTGSVVFKEGTTTLGTVPLDNTGQAVLPTSLATTGRHVITANYLGDASSNAVLAPVLVLMVA
jgi:hypothetical protein